MCARDQTSSICTLCLQVVLSTEIFKLSDPLALSPVIREKTTNFFLEFIDSIITRTNHSLEFLDLVFQL